MERERGFLLSAFVNVERTENRTKRKGLAFSFRYFEKNGRVGFGLNWVGEKGAQGRIQIRNMVTRVSRDHENHNGIFMSKSLRPGLV